MYYIIFIIVGCLIVALLFKPLVGFISYKRDPIRVGQLYIKQSLRKESAINEGLIPDEVFRRLAQQAYKIAELSHSVENDTLMSVYMSYLDNYVDQVHNAMSGYGGESVEDVSKILREYGVRIPQAAA
jgi:hypothetical protein